VTVRTRTYAAPLSALDQVVRLEAGRIRTRKAITANEPFFPGHYPDHPVYPGVFILEAVHQAVRRYAEEHHATARLRHIVSTRFRRPLVPGDVVETDCVCTRDADTGTLQVKAVCSSESGRVADIRAVFHLESHP
jgi:3-hydroxyacyl-[acyl-carrier-protein] dehydratase